MSGAYVMNDQNISMVDVGFLKPIVMTSHVVREEHATTQIRFVFNDESAARKHLPCLKYPSLELCAQATVAGHDLSFFTEKGQVCIDVTTDGVLYDDSRTDFEDKLRPVASAIVQAIGLSDDDSAVGDDDPAVDDDYPAVGNVAYALNSAYRSYSKVWNKNMLQLIKYAVDQLSSAHS